MAKTKLLCARVLLDHSALGLYIDQIVEGPEDVITAMNAAGAVDAHPDAVAYAAGQGAPVVTLENPAAAAELAAAAVEDKVGEAFTAETTAASVEGGAGEALTAETTAE